jgi:predicted MFS family arabinose efflux permease
LAAGAFGIATAVSAPLAGRALDRLGQRRVLPLMAVAFGGALAVLDLGSGHLRAGLIYALAAAAGLTRPPIEAALRAMWPRLARPAEVDVAYALDSTVQELIWIGGPLLLAALLAVGGPRLPLLACSIASVAGTVIYATGLRSGAGRRDAPVAAPGPLRSGGLRVLLVSASCYGIAAGMLNLALVAFAVAHGGAAWAGILVAIWGMGSLAGGLAYGSRNWHRPVEARAMVCLALFSVTLMVLSSAPSLVVLAVLMIPLGVPLSPWLGALSASVQRAVPAASATEAFAWTFSVITVGMAIGSAFGGVIIQATGAQVAFLAAGGFGLGGAVFGACRLAARRHRQAVSGHSTASAPSSSHVSVIEPGRSRCWPGWDGAGPPGGASPRPEHRRGERRSGAA